MELLSLGMETTVLGAIIVFVCLSLLMIGINIVVLNLFLRSKGLVSKNTQDSAVSTVSSSTGSSRYVVADVDDEASIAAIAAVIAYLDAEKGTGTYNIHAPKKVGNSTDPWVLSGRQNLTNLNI